MDSESNSHPRAIASAVDSPQSHRYGVLAFSGVRLQLITRIDRVQNAETRTIEVDTCRAELLCKHEETRAVASLNQLKLVDCAPSCVDAVSGSLSRFNSSSLASSSDLDLEFIC